MNPKLNSSVSVVQISESVIEFFKTNTRQQIHIKVSSELILQIVNSLDGSLSELEICNKFHTSYKELHDLVLFLQKKGILDLLEPKNDFVHYEKFRRVINFLGDYASSHEHLVSMWNSLQNATVLIVGLGAVGTWVACNLAESGVGRLILMDGDTVDLSNLHRQFGFTESELGQRKVDALEHRIHEYTTDIKIVKKFEYLTESNLSMFDTEPLNLVINCADKPNVDTTSLWIGEYCMKRSIPHIVGGGYNMHLSLIGQTIIPRKTACVKCFQKSLEEENSIDSSRVKKLAIKNRKVGSFAPMCSMIASMVGMEAIKVITRCTTPANINRRGEFDIFSMDIKYHSYERRDDCEWCGKTGKYCNP